MNFNQGFKGQHYAKLLADASVKVSSHNLAEVSTASPAEQCAKTARTSVLFICMNCSYSCMSRGSSAAAVQCLPLLSWLEKTQRRPNVHQGRAIQHRLLFFFLF